MTKNRIAQVVPLIGLVVALALVPTALAGKRGGGGASSPSSISMATPLVYDQNGNGLVNYGDAVLFDISTTSTTQPWVNVKCSKGGAVVYNAWNGYFDGALNYNWYFGLASGAWQGGAADCTAYLDMANGRNGWTQLASMSFHVDA